MLLRLRLSGRCGRRRDYGSRGTTLLMPLITAMPPAAGGMGGSDAGATKRPMPSDPFQVILGRPQLLHHGLEMSAEATSVAAERSATQRCGRTYRTEVQDGVRKVAEFLHIFRGNSVSGSFFEMT
ncbi:hypothetical protein CHARACLAT_033687 [Characodon lateralis]|uniref:Uncharacterized protein n=1 Tax=Characodon lateralis TaxID=208331 RepID=A0ABU7F8K9_9TELE|nr:hypothetical protein [Characodon lateralis]